MRRKARPPDIRAAFFQKYADFAVFPAAVMTGIGSQEPGGAQHDQDQCRRERGSEDPFRSGCRSVEVKTHILTPFGNPRTPRKTPSSADSTETRDACPDAP